MPASLAADKPPPFNNVRLEQSCLIRGRPCVVVAWFAAPEPEVGLVRPQLVGSLAIDPDGEVYEELERTDAREVIEALRTRAAAYLEG